MLSNMGHKQNEEAGNSCGLTSCSVKGPAFSIFFRELHTNISDSVTCFNHFAKQCNTKCRWWFKNEWIPTRVLPSWVLCLSSSPSVHPAPSCSWHLLICFSFQTPPPHTHTHITTNLRLSLSASFHSFLSVLVFVYRLYVCVVFLHVDMCVCTLSLAPPSLSACMGNSLLSTSMHTHTHRETTFTSETCTVIPVVSTSSKVTSSDMTFPPANGWYWSQFPVSEVFSWPKKKVWGQKKQLCWGLFTLTHV